LNETSPLAELEVEPETPVIDEAVEEKTPEAIEEEKVQEKEKTKRRFSDRNKEITGKWRQSERENESLRKKLEGFESQSHIKSEPDADDYTDRDKFNEDRETWKTQERAKITAEVTQEVKAGFQKEESERTMKIQREEYVLGREAILKEDPKLHEYELEIDEVVTLYRAPEIQNIILKAKKQGPKIAHYLGTHPDELREIASMSQEDRIFEMAEIKAKLGAKPVKKPSSAPAPTRSEKGSAQRINPTANIGHRAKESKADRYKRINGH
jgi:hypothetical protein